MMISVKRKAPDCVIVTFTDKTQTEDGNGEETQKNN
jgi:hypothetical protein